MITTLCAAVMFVLWALEPPGAQAPRQAGQPSPTGLATGISVDGPFAHGNLAVYVLRGSTSDNMRWRRC